MPRPTLVRGRPPRHLRDHHPSPQVHDRLCLFASTQPPVKLAEQLGGGQFGTVHKASLTDPLLPAGAPAYLVAAKSVKLGAPTDEANALLDEADIDPATAFAMRSLMVSDYRRIVLADPGLPDELVPPGWPERRAAHIAARLYRSLVGPSDSQLAAVCVTGTGSIILRAEAYANRFAS